MNARVKVVARQARGSIGKARRVLPDVEVLDPVTRPDLIAQATGSVHSAAIEYAAGSGQALLRNEEYGRGLAAVAEPMVRDYLRREGLDKALAEFLSGTGSTPRIEQSALMDLPPDPAFLRKLETRIRQNSRLKSASESMLPLPRRSTKPTAPTEPVEPGEEPAEQPPDHPPAPPPSLPYLLGPPFNYGFSYGPPLPSTRPTDPGVLADQSNGVFVVRTHAIAPVALGGDAWIRLGSVFRLHRTVQKLRVDARVDFRAEVHPMVIGGYASAAAYIGLGISQGVNTLGWAEDELTRIHAVLWSHQATWTMSVTGYLLSFEIDGSLITPGVPLFAFVQARVGFGGGGLLVADMSEIVGTVRHLRAGKI